MKKIFHSIQAIYQMHYLIPKSEWTWKKTEWFNANSLSLLRKTTRNSMYFLKLTYSSIYYVNKQHKSLWFEKTTTFISSILWVRNLERTSVRQVCCWYHLGSLQSVGTLAGAGGNPQAARGGTWVPSND